VKGGAVQCHFDHNGDNAVARRNLTKLAKQLAPVYRSASPADVEDDVSLGVWVRRESGEELTLAQAEKLRKLLDAEIDKLPSGEVAASGSYPIYILDLGGADYSIVFPEGKVDLDHSAFWEQVVARIVARHFHLTLEELVNMPYCQRRARINGKIVYYGEKTTKKLLKLIEKAVGETGLEWRYDLHEARLEFDVQAFASLCLLS
jgi:hypothetical protein